MYEAFYGFREKPFNLSPDPDYLFMSKRHEFVYTHLRYAIYENKGFVVITGEIGSGKTTLVKFLLRKLKGPLCIATIYNTNVSPYQFVKLVCKEFGLPSEGLDKVSLWNTLKEFLLQQYNSHRRVIFIIDEAQNLPLQTLEEIRLISNLDADKESFLQIILVGQPELKRKLKHPGLEQLVQRITVYCHLDKLNKEEVAKYIRHRLWIAGCKDLDLFSKEAIELIYKYSRGIPRLINIICDTALLYGFADGLSKIDHKVIEHVIENRKKSGLFFTECLSDSSQKYPTEEVNSRQLKALEQRIEVLEKLVLNLTKHLDFYQKIESHLEELLKELHSYFKNKSD